MGCDLRASKDNLEDAAGWHGGGELPALGGEFVELFDAVVEVGSVPHFDPVLPGWCVAAVSEGGPNTCRRAWSG